MKTISVVKISINNPVLASYIKRIQSWDGQSQLAVTENGFYGSFLEDEFLAASTMEYDTSHSKVNIHMVNGSNQHYDRIQQETTERLTDIARQEYHTEHIQFVYAKKQAINR